jgi:signal transduction histidine kinase
MAQDAGVLASGGVGRDVMFGGQRRAEDASSPRHAQSLRRKLWIAAGIELLALIIFGTLATEIVVHLKRQSDDVDLSHQVIIELTALGGHFEHMLTLAREDPHTAAANPVYQAESAGMMRNISALERLLPIDCPRRKAVQKISALLMQSRAGAPDAWAESPVDPLVLDRLQGLFKDMWAVEQNVLLQSMSAEAAGFRQISRWVLAIAIAGCVPGAVLVFSVRREFTLQRAMSDMLEQHNRDLDAKVKERTAELAAANQSLRQLSAHLHSAREHERTIVAREVHDVLGSTLTALKFELVGVETKCHSCDDGVLRRRQAAVELLDNALLTVRNVVNDLRPSIFDKFGLWEAIAWKAEEFEERMGVHCAVSMSEELPQPPGEVAIGIFRVFEEAMTNIARHAQASRVQINARIEEDAIALDVVDNGRGMSRQQMHRTNSFGLLGMRERAAQWGGTLQVESEQGTGTAVRLRLPLNNIDESTKA